jgi:hypothetical protein
MENTFLTFQGQYYIYGGDQSLDEKGLTIGNYESVWLADLMAAYILEQVEENISATGFLLGINTWFNEFQLAQLATCFAVHRSDVAMRWWSSTLDTKLSVNTDPFFPNLDMEMYWTNGRQLHFHVHLEPNQQLLYMNHGSSHTSSSCYMAIESAVLGRLAKQRTLPSAATLGYTMDQLNPKHTEALQHAGLSRGHFPTLKQVLDHGSGSLSYTCFKKFDKS